MTVPERGRRLSPDERREQIIGAARDLFAERPFTSVTTADVAAAAGVARSLVHHYFGGIRELFLAVAAAGVEELPEVDTLGAGDAPLEERTAHNLRVGLDVVEGMRQTWLAVVGQAPGFGDPEIGELMRATNEESVERTIAMNADVLEDTPAVRFALRCFQQFIVEATRAWLAGEVTREEAESLLRIALRDLLENVIPEWVEPGPS